MWYMVFNNLTREREVCICCQKMQSADLNSAQVIYDGAKFSCVLADSMPAWPASGKAVVKFPTQKLGLPTFPQRSVN